MINIRKEGTPMIFLFKRIFEIRFSDAPLPTELILSLRRSCAANRLLHDACAAVECCHYAHHKLLTGNHSRVGQCYLSQCSKNNLNEPKLPEFLSFIQGIWLQMNYQVKPIGVWGVTGSRLHLYSAFVIYRNCWIFVVFSKQTVITAKMLTSQPKDLRVFKRLESSYFRGKNILAAAYK